MRPINVIVSTETKKGTVRSKAKLTKASDIVYINDIAIPNQQYVGDVTISQLSFVIHHKDKAIERATKFLEKLKRTKVAKIAIAEKAKAKVIKPEAKPKKKAAKRKAKAKKVAKAKTPKTPRLPKAEYFFQQLDRFIVEGNIDKVNFYATKLLNLKEIKVLTEKQIHKLKLDNWFYDQTKELCYKDANGINRLKFEELDDDTTHIYFDI